MALKQSLVLLLGLGLALGCSGDPKKSKKKGKRASLENCPTTPLGPYEYSPDKTPRVELPASAEERAALPMPLATTGGDNGDQSIIYAAALMGYYMMGVQRPITCEDRPGVPCFPFGYEYVPKTDSWTDEDMIHRQSVGTFGLTWLYKVTGREEFRLAAESAIQSMVPRKRSWDNGRTKIHDLGNSALMIMTLTHHGKLTGDTSRDQLIDELGAYVMSKVDESGEITSGGPLQWQQMHQALWRMYDYTGDETYLDALVRVGRYGHAHKHETDRSNKKHYFAYAYLYGLWANEPLTELYALRPDEQWIPEMVYASADDTIAHQYTTKNAQHCDWVGGYKPNNNKGHPNWNHTIKLEAVIDAYRFAERNGDAERAATYKASALAATDFLLRFQHRLGENPEWPNEAKAVGGVPLYGSKDNVRVDIPGHGSIAILKVATYLGAETAPGAPVLDAAAAPTEAAPSEAAPPEAAPPEAAPN